MVEDLFGSLSTQVSEITREEADTDLVVLLRDGEVVGSSSLSTLRDTLLLVNSDYYRTGPADLGNLNAPDVILELSDTVFTLQGYPDSNTEKLVLTLISRYIEQRAWKHEAGSLRTSFQFYSLLYNERATREVYRQLGQIPDLTVDVYGVPDREPPELPGVTVHETTDDEVHETTDDKLEQYWYVVHRIESATSAALLAKKTGPTEWEGFWTFDTNTVRTLDQHIQRTF
jgi:DICT domain-containing protein